MDFKHFGLPSLAILSVPTSKEFSILSSKSWTYTAAKKGEKEKPSLTGGDSWNKEQFEIPSLRYKLCSPESTIANWNTPPKLGQFGEMPRH